jgi:hypothetical protein
MELGLVGGDPFFQFSFMAVVANLLRPKNISYKLINVKKRASD